MMRITLLLGWIVSSAVTALAETQPPLPSEMDRIVAALPKVPAGLNENYRLKSWVSKRVAIAYEHTMTAPHLEAMEWVMLLAKPPLLPGQRPLKIETVPPGEPFFERSDLRREMIRVNAPVSREEHKKAMTCKAELEFDLYAREVVRGQSSGTAIGGVISEEDRKNALQRTEKFDYLDKRVLAWMVEKELIRNKKEGEVDFARRVFREMTKQYRYEYLGKQDRTAGSVCVAGRSDCGGLSILFVTVLRSQGIPARILVGRWALSSEKNEKLSGVDYVQQHVKSEFFAQGVGWVPVDVSLGVTEKDRDGTKFFARDMGDFVVLHVDGDLIYDSVYFGEKTAEFLQGVDFWATGKGNFDGRSHDQSWKVESREWPGER